MIRPSLSRIHYSCFWVRTCLFLLSCLGLSACLHQPCPPLSETSQENRSVVIDTDLAFDDRLAVLFLLKRPEIRIKAITVNDGGLGGDCQKKIQVLKELLTLTKKDGIATACDSGRMSKEKAADKAPVEFLSSTIQDSSRKVTLLVLGPLTNVAEAFRRSPSLEEKVDRIYLMGGAFDVPGNVLKPETKITNPVAEWNFYSDPKAANQVLRSKAPVTLIPLDATNQVPLTPQFIEELKTRPRTAHTAYVLDLLTGYYKPMMKGLLYFWDPLAAAILSNETIAGFEKRRLRVIEEDGPLRGKVIIDPAGPEVRAVFQVDRERFEQEYLNTIAPLSFSHPN